MADGGPPKTALWVPRKCSGNRAYHERRKATNPDPGCLFALCGSHGEACQDAWTSSPERARKLWSCGRREGFTETAAENTDLDREWQQMGRFLQMVVEI